MHCILPRLFIMMYTSVFPELLNKKQIRNGRQSQVLDQLSQYLYCLTNESSESVSHHKSLFPNCFSGHSSSRTTNLFMSALALFNGLLLSNLLDERVGQQAKRAAETLTQAFARQHTWLFLSFGNDDIHWLQTQIHPNDGSTPNHLRHSASIYAHTHVHTHTFSALLTW